VSLRHCLNYLALTGFLSTAYAGLDEGLAAYDKGDFKAAAAEFESAAEQGNARAQSIHGAMYDNGQGVVQDHKAAEAWFSVAATNGDSDAVKSRDIAAKKLTPGQLVKGQAAAKVYFNTYQPK
jgi:TPR repeat protein